jgi:hypothetical protein
MLSAQIEPSTALFELPESRGFEITKKSEFTLAMTVFVSAGRLLSLLAPRFSGNATQL